MMMNPPPHFKKIFLALFGAFLFSFPNFIQAQTLYDLGWKINSFDTKIQIQNDTSLLVTETIEADFSKEAHHGIFRLLPVNYTDQYGNSLNLRVEVMSVVDQAGNPWWYEVSNEGRYLNIQAGDESQLFTDAETFKISYKVERAVTQQSDHDEVYWNATGTEWKVPISKASAQIIYPELVDKTKIGAVCFTGPEGSKASDCKIEQTDQATIFITQNILNPLEGLTIVLGLPQGILQWPDFKTQGLWFLTDNWPYLLPLATFLFFFLGWFKLGRDPKTDRSIIIPHYEAPENLRPAEVGTILDERVDQRDLSATMVDLAVRGYLKIEETVTDKLFGKSREYTLIKLKNGKDLKDYEKKLLNEIFGESEKKDLEDLKYSFYKCLNDLKDKIYDALVQIKVFSVSPDKIRTRYLGLGGTVLAIGMVMAFFLFDFMLAIPVGVFLSGVVILAFAPFMPRRTKKGMDLYYQILGLEDFIRTAEKDRLNFQEKENVFEKLLPYAMVFNLAEKWSKAFETIYKGKPAWFETNDPQFMNHFSTYYFWTSLNNLSKVANTSMTTAPRSASSNAWSGGSGFSGGSSGGGFGGGGGGAW